MKRFIYFFAFILFVTSCGDDQVKIKPEQLIGKLQIKVAKRNEKVTKLLSGGFFEFKDNKTMVTNIKGDTIVHEYQLSKNKISTSGKDPMEFEILYLSADTIILSSKIGKSKFEFLTLKD